MAELLNSLIMYMFLASFLIGIAIFIYQSVNLVPYGFVRVVERLGELSRELKPGLHLVLWPLDQIHHVRWTYTSEQHTSRGAKLVDVVEETSNIDMRQRMFDIPPTDAVTNDRLRVRANTMLTIHITNIKDAVYGVADLLKSLETNAACAVKRAVSELTLEQIRSDFSTIQNKIKTYLVETVKTYGVAIESVRVQDILPSDEVLKQTEAVTRQKLEAQQRCEQQVVQRKIEEMKQKLELDLKARRHAHERDEELANEKKKEEIGEIHAKMHERMGDAEAHKLKKIKDAGGTIEYLIAESKARSLSNLPRSITTLVMGHDAFAGTTLKINEK